MRISSSECQIAIKSFAAGIRLAIGEGDHDGCAIAVMDLEHSKAEIIYSEAFGNPRDWEAPFDLHAREKALMRAVHGVPISELKRTSPHLLKLPGLGSVHPGTLVRDGILVAVAGGGRGNKLVAGIVIERIFDMIAARRDAA